MGHVHHSAAHAAQALTVGRRGMLLGTAAAVVGGALGGPAGALADDADDDRRVPLPQPKPIPGGVAPGFHVWGPGPAGQVLPFSKFVLSNLDTDPSVISDFDGFSALAYPVGSAHGSDGKRYNLEGDMRVFRGMYVPLNGGGARQGAFGFV